MRSSIALGLAVLLLSAAGRVRTTEKGDAPRSESATARRSCSASTTRWPTSRGGLRVTSPTCAARCRPENDPAFWKPDDAAIARFQTADLILRNGAGYAKWMKTVSLPDVAHRGHERGASPTS